MKTRLLCALFLALIVLPMVGCDRDNIVNPNRKDFLSAAERKDKRGK